jgi:outer membrane protein W
MMKRMKLLAAAVALLVSAVSALPAQAGDNNGNFQVKIGVSGVLTDDHTSSLTANGRTSCRGIGPIRMTWCCRR